MSKKIESLTTRRGFFKNFLSSAGKTASKTAKVIIDLKLKRSFLRPPGALPEPEFLLACSRCDECSKACPYGAIHLIDDMLSPGVNRTPFIDPYHSPCQYCSDTPCISACPEEALQASFRSQAPVMGKARVERNHCLTLQGQVCDYCYKSCPKGINAISKGEDGAPVIDIEACVGCGKCAYICVSQTGKAIVIDPL